MRDLLMERALALAARFPHLGIGPDLAALPLADLWGVYRFLACLAMEAGYGTAA